MVTLAQVNINKFKILLKENKCCFKTLIDKNILMASYRWTPTSANELKVAEEALLEHANVKSEGFYVDVGKVNGENCRIWTRKFGKHDDEKVIT